MGTVNQPRQHRHGFTLVELLVVLALLAMLAGMAVPRLFGVLSKSRVQQAAQQMASELNNARLLAITHGCPYELRVSDGGSRYTIRPKHAADPGVLADSGQDPDGFGITSQSPDASGRNNLNSSIPSQLGGSSSGASGDLLSSDASDPSMKPRPKPELIDGQLENGVVFGSGLSADINDEFRIPFALPTSDEPQTSIDEGLESVAGSESIDWQRLVVFYPDGRSETTIVTLVGEDGRTVELSIRGLTGAVRITPVQRAAASHLASGDDPANDVPANDAPPNEHDFQTSNSATEGIDAPY